MDMRRALKDKLVNYKIPQVLKVVESIPRNAMGKSKSKSHPSIPSLHVTNGLSQQKAACSGSV
jgi:hypothetical protein